MKALLLMTRENEWRADAFHVLKSYFSRVITKLTDGAETWPQPPELAVVSVDPGQNAGKSIRRLRRIWPDCHILALCCGGSRRADQLIRIGASDVLITDFMNIAWPAYFRGKVRDAIMLIRKKEDLLA